MKKLVSGFLALCMALSLSAPALADAALSEALLTTAELPLPTWSPTVVTAADDQKGAKDWTEVGAIGDWHTQLNGISTESNTVYKIKLTGNFTLDTALSVADTNTLELDLNGCALTAAQGQRHLIVNGTLILTDSAGGGRLDGGGHSGGVEVKKKQDTANGVFTMNSGAIVNCKNDTSGAGVYVNGGTFTMAGGTIDSCTASGGRISDGGGVAVKGGAFIMTSGTISNCTAATSGGGVYLDIIGGEVKLQDGVVSGCTANTGGGIYMGGGTFNMTNSTISNCSAGRAGGGVCVDGGVSTLQGGTIENCCVSGTGSDTGGGGVALGGGMLTLKSGAIRGCSANSGGGALAWKGVFKLEGGAINNCTATEGGGVYVEPIATFQVQGSPSVTDNVAGDVTNNIYLRLNSNTQKGAVIEVTGALDTGAALGVTLGGNIDEWKDKTFLQDLPSGNRAFFPDSDSTQYFTSGAIDSFGNFATAPYVGPAPVTPDIAVTLDKATLSLKPGDTAKLKATLTPADATYKYIFWESSDEAVATVSDSGLVTAVADGTATVTAKSWYGHEAACAVTVKTPDEPTPPQPVDPWPTEGLEGFVTRCYRVALSRDPDKAGHADWVRWLKDGTVDATSCTSGFVFSKEMNNKSLSDEDFVKTLYRLFMDREGEAAGVAFWTNYLNGGHSREEVFHGFADSVEFARIKTNYGIR